MVPPLAYFCGALLPSLCPAASACPANRPRLAFRGSGYFSPDSKTTCRWLAIEEGALPCARDDRATWLRRRERREWTSSRRRESCRDSRCVRDLRAVRHLHASLRISRVGLSSNFGDSS